MQDLDVPVRSVYSDPLPIPDWIGLGFLAGSVGHDGRGQPVQVGGPFPPA